jgi:hypothetical protein
VGGTSVIKLKSNSQTLISKQREFNTESNYNRAILEFNKLFEIENQNSNKFNNKLMIPSNDKLDQNQNCPNLNNIVSDDENDINKIYYSCSESDDDSEAEISNHIDHSGMVEVKISSLPYEIPANKTLTTSTFRDNRSEKTNIDPSPSKKDHAEFNVKLNSDSFALGDSFGQNKDANPAHGISASLAKSAGNSIQVVSDLDVQNKVAGKCASLKRGGQHVFYQINYRNHHWHKPTHNSLERQMTNLGLTKSPNLKLGCGYGLDWSSVSKSIVNIDTNLGRVSIIKPPEPPPDPPPEPPPIINPPDPPP